ncbi:hypothetical protein FHR55_004023 [Xanthomonas arboricola]
MRELILYHKEPDERAWVWMYLSRLLEHDLSKDRYEAIYEDSSPYDDNVGGPAYVGGDEDIDLTSLPNDADAVAPDGRAAIHSDQRRTRSHLTAALVRTLGAPANIGTPLATLSCDSCDWWPESVAARPNPSPSRRTSWAGGGACVGGSCFAGRNPTGGGVVHSLAGPGPMCLPGAQRPSLKSREQARAKICHEWYLPTPAPRVSKK